MSGTLEGAFRADVGLDAEDAVSLAREARMHLSVITGSREDTDEDLVTRLRDPRIFGAFVEPFLRERRLSRPARIGLAEHVFDLLPLPQGEGDVILVEARAPPRLLGIAVFLAREDAFSVLHLMHLVYSVFLDRSLVTGVDRRTRSAALRAVLVQPEANAGLRTLYAALHLAAIPEAEAHSELRRILRARDVPEPVKDAIASLVGSEDGGVSGLLRLAQAEGLLPPEAGRGEDLPVVANIPRMPARLAPVGRRLRARHGRR